MKLVWSLIVVSIIFSLGGLFVVFHSEIEVQPVKVLNPTNFASPSEIGAITFRRFWQEFNNERLIVLGSSPFLKDYDQVWRGLIAVAHSYKIVYTNVFEQQGLRALSPNSQALDWVKITAAIRRGERVLVHVVATDLLWSEVEAKIQGGFIIFQSLLPLEPGEMELLKNSCNLSDQKFQISCKSLQTFRGGKRKKFDPHKLTAVIEKYGPREHLLFMHE